MTLTWPVWPPLDISLVWAGAKKYKLPFLLCAGPLSISQQFLSIFAPPQSRLPPFEFLCAPLFGTVLLHFLSFNIGWLIFQLKKTHRLLFLFSLPCAEFPVCQNWRIHRLEPAAPWRIQLLVQVPGTCPFTNLYMLMLCNSAFLLVYTVLSLYRQCNPVYLCTVNETINLVMYATFYAMRLFLPSYKRSNPFNFCGDYQFMS